MIASVVAEISIFIIQMIYIKDIISYKTIFSSFYKNVLAGLIMFIIVYYVGIKMYASVIVTLIQIFVGFLIYSIIIFILKDEILYEVLLLIKTKIKGVKNE